MSKADLNATEFAVFHPAAHYESPDEVLNDRELSAPLRGGIDARSRRRRWEGATRGLSSC
jgi:hypothetical protein